MTSYVLLHGFTGTPDVWNRVGVALPDATLLTCPKLGGHAGEVTSSQSFIEEVDRIGALVAMVQPSDNHLMGYSLGGRIALGLLIRHPKLWSTATIIGAHPGLESGRRSRIAADEHWAHMLETEGIESFLSAWGSLPLFASQRRLPPAIRERQQAWRSAHSPAGLAWSLRTLGLGKMPSWRHRLRSIATPVTFVAGGDDEKFAKLADWMAGCAPNASLRRIKGCGHNVVLERPDALNSILNEVRRK